MALVAAFFKLGVLFVRGEVKLRRSQFLPNSLADRFVERSSVIIIAPLFQRIRSFFFFLRYRKELKNHGSFLNCFTERSFATLQRIRTILSDP